MYADWSSLTVELQSLGSATQSVLSKLPQNDGKQVISGHIYLVIYFLSYISCHTWSYISCHTFLVIFLVLHFLSYISCHIFLVIYILCHISLVIHFLSYISCHTFLVTYFWSYIIFGFARISKIFLI